MKHWILVIFQFLVFSANAQIADKTLPQLRADLNKIEKSIEITRQKMREVKDVGFVPDLYFVLAELYVDKSRYLYTINREENPDTPINELDFADAQKSKKQAIEIYTRFIENFPKSDKVDKAYFFMAHEYRELGQTEQMVTTYLKLTKDFPKSEFWEESQLILGDYFLETKKDPRMAQDFYQKILERPENPFMPSARYKLGWTYINQTKFYEALLAFEGVLTIDAKISLEGLPEIYKKSDVKRDSLMAMVWPYSEQEKLDPDKANALEYFERLSPNRVTLQKVLLRLAKRLMLKEKVDQAIPVYFRLMEITHNLEDRIATIDSFYEAYRKSKKTWPVEDLIPVIAESLLRIRPSSAVTADEKKKIEKNWEIYLRDFATQMQKRAQASRTESALNQAIAAYDVYLEVFPRSRFANALLLNRAEAYFALRQYARAGYNYESLVRRGQNKKDIFDDAIQSYARALKDSDKLSRLEIIESREGFRDLGQAYVKRFPRDPANAMILFNIGRTFYDERDFAKAVVQFQSFLRSFPAHKEATTAGQLILDSFNQREDYEGMIKAGKELIANRRLSNPQFKADVAEIIKQAEFRKIQDQVGDPRSRDYAKKLLGFAAKYKGTALGDQALYEAFTSLKAKKDPAAYEPGEQLLEKHSDSKYAKEVVAQMGQMALNTADYKRAARYFETYARKYPADASSKDLLKSAAQMRELMGDHKEAAENHRDLGNSEESARQYVLAQDWPRVSQTLAARAPTSLRGNYWLGLALFRQGQRDSSKGYFLRAAQSATSTFEEKTMAAHSLYLLAAIDLKEYQALQLGSGDEAAITKAKSEKLTKLSTVFNQVINYGNGRWTIASLYELGRANEEFAQFLSNASLPPGLNASQQAQFQQLIAQQVTQFRNKSRGFFKSCTDNAEKFEVFTSFVKGCQSQGQVIVDEAVEERSMARASDTAPTESRAIRGQLFDQPRNVKLLVQLGESYVKVRDYAMARLIFSRALEIQAKNSQAMAWIGVTLMYLNDLESASEQFKATLKVNSREPLALYGLAALYKQFGFSVKSSQALGRIKGLPKPMGPVHPWMVALTP
ncbi:MAG: tetratricopeptide repeat protein [Pseudobdellovibrionaceae bacterium]